MEDEIMMEEPIGGEPIADEETELDVIPNLNEPTVPIVSGGENDDYEQMYAQMQRLERENQRKEEALRLYFDTEDPVSAAFANAQGKTQEEVAQEFQEQEMFEMLVRENEELKNQTLRISAEAAMKQDLSAIQALDPTIKNLEELGSTFMNLIATGTVDATEAYYAAKAKSQRENKISPGEIGRINMAPVEKDFYTKAEVESMSQEEISKNYNKVRNSMSKWK